MNFSAVLESMSAIRWWWLVPAVVLNLSVYVCAAWEWHLLLKPVGWLPLRRSTLALFAGRFANDVLPVHAGYAIRIYLASRWLGSGLAPVIPSLLIERLFDGLWLAIGIGLLTLFFPLPEHLARAGGFLVGFIVVGAVIVTWIILRSRKEGAGPPPVFFRWKAVRHVKRFINEINHGIRSIGRSQVILAALLLSIVKLVLQAGAFLCVLSAYDFTFSFWVKMAIFMITYIGISVPSTPASLGVFQLFCAAGLRFFGVAKPAASGFALLAYVVLTVPLALAGFIAVTQSGLTLSQVRHEIREYRRPAR